MTKRQKLLEKLLRKPAEMRFEDIELILGWHGFTTSTEGSSHRVYRNTEGKRITIAIKGGQVVKRQYLTEIIAALGLEER